MSTRNVEEVDNESSRTIKKLKRKLAKQQQQFGKETGILKQELKFVEVHSIHHALGQAMYIFLLTRMIMNTGCLGCS